MMRFTVTVLALVLFVSCAFSATCTGNASVAPRASGGSWSDATYNYQTYDIALSNTGSCAIDSFSIAFSFTPSNASITDFWNMILADNSGKWNINAQTLHVSSGPLLPIGYTYPASVGFTLRFPKSSSASQVSLQFTVACNSCGGTTSVPTQSPSTSTTSVPTGAPSFAPTTAPTSAPTAPPSGSCSATVLLIARSGAHWTDASINYQIYDISVTNNGSCALDVVRLQFSFSSNASISRSWNLQQQGAIWLLGTSTLNILNGHWLAPGQTSSGAAGFTLGFPAAANYVLSVSARVQSSSCDSACSNSTSGATSTPTSAPTTSPTTGGTAPPTSTPTGHPTSPPSEKCRVMASIARDTSTAPWTTNGQTQAVYHISVTNSGVCPVSALTLSFSPINVVSSWNLQSVIGGYSIQNFGPSIGQNGVYLGSGFVLADVAGPISVLTAMPTCLPC